jgi:hypothetical protein
MQWEPSRSMRKDGRADGRKDRWTDGQTDRHDEDNSRFWQLREHH